jgi:hypothetical protein
METCRMSDPAAQSIRQAVMGGDRPFRVIEGKPRGPTRPVGEDNEPWPILPLGHNDGTFHFLDVAGQHRGMSARQLGARHDMVGLFGGNDAWLRRQFPKKKAETKKDADGNEQTIWHTIDFSINTAVAALQRACFEAGFWGLRMRLRPPGIWRDTDGRPVVHCGYMVLLRGQQEPAGTREGNQVFVYSDATARPGVPCPANIGQELHARLRDLWRWREPGAPVAILGLVCNGYYGAAIDWRPSGFVMGGTGSGKSKLLGTVRACWPECHYDNDTTKPGIEQAVNGRAVPIIIDETNDTANRSAGRQLADMVLTSAGGEGTQGSRGTLDGKGRRIELAASFVMFAINPPDLEPQHLGRMTLLEALAPEAGADNSAAHDATIAFARAHQAELWGRALAGWDRYHIALERLREGLRKVGCSPREMDHLGALLAGYWVLTEEGLPDDRGVRIAINALHGASADEPGLIRSRAEMEQDSRPRRMLQHLQSSHVYLHRSSEREPIGKLIEIGWRLDRDLLVRDDQGTWGRSDEAARELLTHYGIRVVLRCERFGEPKPINGCFCQHCKDRRGPIPRGSDDYGVWFANSNPELKRLFTGTAFEGERWQHEMRRLPTARTHRSTVRIGSVPVRATWLGKADFVGPEEREDDVLV